MKLIPRLIDNSPIPVGTGTLLPFDLTSTSWLDIQRVFIISDYRDSVRGGHAHKRALQALQVASGKVKCRLSNILKEEWEFTLTPQSGVLLTPNMFWLELFFELDSTIIVLTDLPFDEKDYIRSQEEFLTIGKNL